MPDRSGFGFLEMPAEEIEIRIGQALLDQEFGSKDASDSEKQAVSRRWFEANKARIRNAVCRSLVKNGPFASSKQERNLLFAAVIDTLARVGGWQIPVALLAAKLIHYGLDRLCKEVEATFSGQAS